MYQSQCSLKISTYYLLSLTSINSLIDYQYIDNKIKKIYHDVFGFKKYGMDYSSNLMLYNDGTSPIGYFRPSYEDFIFNLAEYLNIKINPYMVANYELDNIFNERLNVLKNIKTPQDLAKEFPIIYNDFLIARNLRNELESLSRDSFEKEEIYKEKRHEYFSYGFKWNFERFIKTQTKMYTRFVDKRYELKEKIENTSFNPYFIKNLDINKLAMIVAFGYLQVASTTNNRYTRNTYLKLTEMYFNSKYDKSKEIFYNDEIINIELLKYKYNLLKNKSREETKIVEWRLIPEGMGYSKVKSTNSKPRTIKIDSKKIDHYKELGKRNKDFYDNTPYMAKAVGTLKFEGYVAYFYPNGIVLLDREFRESAPSTAVGNAIYYMHAVDFEFLSRLDKALLRKHPNVGRITHQGSWEDRALKIINSEGNMEDIEKTNEIVKQLQKK